MLVGSFWTLLVRTLLAPLTIYITITTHASRVMDDFDFSFSGSLLDANTTLSVLTIDGQDVKLADGRVITLRKKPTTAEPPSIDNIAGSFMDIDKIFAEAELANRIKNTDKDLEYFRPTLASSSSTTLEMWTEKYRPQKFLDLCSAGNDKAYRQLFRWLKDWGQPVDPADPPKHKILLVHGPPGMGKTLAVHICARQLGYHLEELNAANSLDQLPLSSAANFDDKRAKTSSALRLRISNALSANTIGALNKPTCLVIDEIDLATNTVDIVRALNDIIRDDIRASRTYDNDKKKRPKRLLRPIICIANEIFPQGSRHLGAVAAMEKLRPICDIVNLKKPVKTGIHAIRDHLQWIAKQEGINLDHKGVTSVVDMCDADIRACINHLQFASRANKSSHNGTYKDGLVSWTEIVDLLFKHNPKVPKDQAFQGLCDTFLGESSKAAPHIDRVMRGVFNRYLDYEDNNMAKPLEMADWFAHYDLLNLRGEATQGLGYGCILALKTWITYQDVARLRSAEPVVANARHMEYELMDTMRSNTAVAELIWSRLPVNLQRELGLASLPGFLTMVIPHLFELLHPLLSSKIKLNLLEEEKLALLRVVTFVKQMDLRMETTKDHTTGQVSLAFNPSLDSFINYQSEWATQLWLFAEKGIQRKRIQLFPLLLAEFDAPKPQLKRLLAAMDDGNVAPKRAKTTMDFFKQQYDGVNNKKESSPVPAATPTERIWVKYNEGFLNAVRKTIRWQDLWRA